VPKGPSPTDPTDEAGIPQAVDPSGTNGAESSGHAVLPYEGSHLPLPLGTSQDVFASVLI
jgi:hypothetical protein